MKLKGLKGRKLLFYAALVAAVAGAFLFHLRAVRREPPLVSIGAIRPLMNLRCVRVQGVLVDSARPMPDGSILYMVDDGTGMLPVYLAGPGAKDPLPGGIRVAAFGNLGISANNVVRMRGRSVEHMVGKPVDFPSGPVLAEASEARKGSRLTVRGTVVKVFTPQPGSKAPNKIVLTDPSGTLEAVHWFKPERLIAIGDALEIHGTVDAYKGKTQLKVWEAGDIRMIE